MNRGAFVGLQRFDGNHLAFVAAGAFIGSLSKEALLGERSALAAGRKLEFFVSQSGQGLRQPFVFAGVGQKAVVSHLSKMRRQDMKAKPSEELGASQCHFLFSCAIGIILVGKTDSILSDVQDAVVGDLPARPPRLAWRAGRWQYGESTGPDIAPLFGARRMVFWYRPLIAWRRELLSSGNTGRVCRGSPWAKPTGPVLMRSGGVA